MTQQSKKPCVLVARLPNTRQGRAALAVLRKSVNRKAYKLRVLFSGPRSTHWCTHREDAKVFRVYLDRKAGGQVSELRAEVSRLHGLLAIQREEVARLIRLLDNQREHAAVWRDAAGGLAEKVKRWKERSIANEMRLALVPGWILQLVYLQARTGQRFRTWLSAILPNGASRIRGGDSHEQR